jgi:hypothetical protein
MFRVAVSTPMGAKRGRGRGSFIDSVAEAINSFYGEVMQNLKAWTATPPKLREIPTVPEPPSLASTALSSQDGVKTPDPISPLAITASMAPGTTVG